MEQYWQHRKFFQIVATSEIQTNFIMYFLNFAKITKALWSLYQAEVKALPIKVSESIYILWWLSDKKNK